MVYEKMGEGARPSGSATMTMLGCISPELANQKPERLKSAYLHNKFERKVLHL
jgi:hypothetical protein